ncbi:MAG: hypothetical protein WCP97_09025 [bacterium]
MFKRKANTQSQMSYMPQQQPQQPYVQQYQQYPTHTQPYYIDQLHQQIHQRPTRPVDTLSHHQGMSRPLPHMTYSSTIDPLTAQRPQQQPIRPTRTVQGMTPQPVMVQQQHQHPPAPAQHFPTQLITPHHQQYHQQQNQPVQQYYQHSNQHQQQKPQSHKSKKGFFRASQAISLGVAFGLFTLGIVSFLL